MMLTRNKSPEQSPPLEVAMNELRRTVFSAVKRIGPVAAALILLPDAAGAASLDGASLRWPWALPFIGILLTIAAGPLLFPHVWHRHYGKFAFAWSLLTVGPLTLVYGVPAAAEAFVHAILGEYLSFIILLFALYVVAGGILVTGNLRGGADRQHCNSRLRHRDRELRRHYWCGNNSDPPAAARQRRARTQCPRGRVLHHPGRQYRRRALAAWRSTAVRRLPARRRFLLDHAASAVADGHAGAAAACGIRGAGCLVSAQGTCEHCPARSARPAGPRRDQPRPDRRDRCRHPGLVGVAARRQLRHLRHPARTAEHRPRWRAGADRIALALAYARRAPKSQ